MNADDQLAALKRRLIRDEITRRNPLDVDAVEALIGSHYAIAPDGRIVAHNPDGGALVGNGPGFTKDVGEVLDDLTRQRPTLFRGGPASPGKGDIAAEYNPFAKGPGFSITQQMILLKNEPDRAEYLQHLASLGRH